MENLILFRESIVILIDTLKNVPFTRQKYTAYTLTRVVTEIAGRISDAQRISFQHLGDKRLVPSLRLCRFQFTRCVCCDDDEEANGIETLNDAGCEVVSQSLICFRCWAHLPKLPGEVVVVVHVLRWPWPPCIAIHSDQSRDTEATACLSPTWRGSLAPVFNV